jgi:hypothetical protein
VPDNPHQLKIQTTKKSWVILPEVESQKQEWETKIAVCDLNGKY